MAGNIIREINSALFKILNYRILTRYPLVSGPLEFEADSGASVFIDMPVTSDASAGTEESMAMRIDGDNILKLYAESDGSGGIQNERVDVPGHGVRVTGLAAYANNAAAITGGLVAGDFYRIGDSVCVVH